MLFSVQDKLGVREVPFYALEKPGSKSIIPLAILFSCLSCLHPLRYFPHTVRLNFAYIDKQMLPVAYHELHFIL